jgi:hypothetical protein
MSTSGLAKTVLVVGNPKQGWETSVTMATNTGRVSVIMRFRDGKEPAIVCAVSPDTYRRHKKVLHEGTIQRGKTEIFVRDLLTGTEKPASELTYNRLMEFARHISKPPTRKICIHK